MYRDLHKVYNTYYSIQTQNVPDEPQTPRVCKLPEKNDPFLDCQHQWYPPWHQYVLVTSLGFLQLKLQLAQIG